VLVAPSSFLHGIVIGSTIAARLAPKDRTNNA